MERTVTIKFGDDVNSFYTAEQWLLRAGCEYVVNMITHTTAYVAGSSAEEVMAEFQLRREL